MLTDFKSIIWRDKLLKTYILTMNKKSILLDQICSLMRKNKNTLPFPSTNYQFKSFNRQNNSYDRRVYVVNNMNHMTTS